MLLTTAPDNAFDVPLSVFAEFSGASAAAGARRRVSPFYFQNFSRSQLANGSEVLTPNGEPQFLVRFTAGQPGRYTYELHGATAMDGRTTSGSVQVVLSHTHARARARSLARSRSLTVALTVSLRCLDTASSTSQAPCPTRQKTRTTAPILPRTISAP